MNKQTTEDYANAQTDKEDILDIIIEDHKPLKDLIKIMKGDNEYNEKFEAFKEFAPLLTIHAKSEEQSLYKDLKVEDVEDLRQMGFEGEVEHGIADQLVEELKRTKEKDPWMARVKVLAEAVEHHIKEEEKDEFPLFKKKSTASVRKQLGEKYLKLKAKWAEEGATDSPSEDAIH